MAATSPTAAPSTPAPIPNLASLIPADAVLSLSARVAIAAPPALVWEAHNDTRTWPAWNSFVAAVEVTPPKGSSSSAITDADADPDAVLRAGTKMTMHCKMHPGKDGTKAQRMVVTGVEEDEAAGKRSISWSVEGFPRVAMRTGRTSEVVAEEGGEACVYSTWEAMAGPLAWTVKYMYAETLQARFEDWARDLKEYAEGRWKEEQAGGGT